MKFFNTLTGSKEEFKPIDKEKVSLYTCGPTVYDSAHIGNLRAYSFGDVLKRTLAVVGGYQVKHVMNLTDVDDKTIKRSGGKKADFEALTKMCEEKFWSDMKQLNNLAPDVITRATEYIDKMVGFIEDLLKLGYAYRARDNSIYFSIEKYQKYGALSRLEKREVQSGARVNQDNYDKENPADFALWKAWDPADGEIFWITSLGKGRPGWHIECSVMSSDTLGETIDIHTGGVDLVFPHHENEIAQSEARSGKKFVNYWLHNEHLLVDGKKMSKSLGNFYTLDDLIEHGFDALDFRYLVLGAHYRSKLNFTWEGLEAARNSRLRLNRLVLALGSSEGEVSQAYLQEFEKNMADDLSTPEALAIVWNMLRDEETADADKLATVSKMDKVLGLKLLEEEIVKIPEEVAKLANERKKARESKDFQKSDELRDKIMAKGYLVEDLPGNDYRIHES